MAGPILLCTDGSELAEQALAAGLAVLPDGADLVVASVVEPADASLVTGTGMAGGVVSAEELEAIDRDAARAGEEAAAHTVAALGLDGASTALLRGAPGASLCEYAVEIGARAIVIGSRGRGGLKRAVLGSVSDHVVRHAPCPVIVTRPERG